jgi:phosphopantetheinyl transferase
MQIIEWAPITDTEWIPQFGDELKRHIETFMKPDARYASCSAWGLLQKVLKENKLGYGNVEFEEKGKPFFSDHPLYFSLSHSRGICAVSVSDGPTGIDVELCRDKYKENLVDRSLSKKEKLEYDGDFTRFWCKKESIAKLTGQGITGYPNEIETEDMAYTFCEKKICFKEKYYWLVVAAAC